MKRLIALTACLLTLTGCLYVRQSGEETEQLGLWFAVVQDGGWGQESVVALETRDWEDEPDAQALLAALLAGPEGEGLYAPFPEGLSVLELTVEDGLAQVDFNEQYGGLSGFELTLADYCVALTLCQLEEIETVRILVEGELLPYRSRQDLRGSDILLALGGEEDDSFIAALYFPCQDGSFQVEYRLVEPEGGSAEESVLAQLLAGPETAEGCLSLPAGTSLLSVSVEDGVCLVDLSGEFVSAAPDGEEAAGATLYAVVNTLCALKDVDQVRVLVEGEALESYGPMAITGPLTATE
ncbi:MAG: GerMN domain-containing protein [Oscillospiraceae bacterium]|nr:GerMN domain-containing protein [Oscillospiraceae bacterium]